MRRQKTMLVVDFDYFFRVIEMPSQQEDPKDSWHWQLYDWGHREAPFFQGPVWTIRASSFLAHNLPLPGTTGLERDFWQRFTIRQSAPVYVADSNVHSFQDGWLHDTDQIWLYDAHHDSGYGFPKDKSPIEVLNERGQVTCEDWLVPYAIAGAQIHTRYPRWRTYAFDLEPQPAIKIDREFDDEQPLPVIFDRVSICRSGAWVPPWLDQAFMDFVNTCPGKLQPIERDLLPDRLFSLEAARQMAEVQNRVTELNRGDRK